MTNKKALILLFDKCEECELIITIDLLRRAGINVTIANVDDNMKPVVCDNNVKILPDIALKEVENELFDCIVVPGGPGFERLEKLENIGVLLRRHFDNNKLVCAICAGPNVLQTHKIGVGKCITSYPSFESRFKETYQWKNQRVVRDGNLITSQAPGTAFEFSLEVVDYLLGFENKNNLVSELIIRL